MKFGDFLQLWNSLPIYEQSYIRTKVMEFQRELGQSHLDNMGKYLIGVMKSGA